MAADFFAKIALSPILIAQALQVRRTAQLLPEPPGPRQGDTGHGPGLSLLILGDSSAAGVGASHQTNALSGQLAQTLARHKSLRWQLEAETGATSASALAHLNSLEPVAFDTAIVVLGVNDVTHQVSLSRFLSRRREIHDTLRKRFKINNIIASGLPPMGHFPLLPQPLRWTLGRSAFRFDTALARLCSDDPNAMHLPLNLPFEPKYVATDGFHPSEAAYAKWAEMLGKTLLQTP